MSRLNDTEAIVRKGLRGGGYSIQTVENGVNTKVAPVNKECCGFPLMSTEPRQTSAGTESLGEAMRECNK